MNEWKKVELSKPWNSKNEDGSFALKEGDELVGIYQSMEENIGANSANIYTFKTPDKKFVSVWGSTILDARFKNLDAGEEVRIVYHGLVDSKTAGRSYHNYEVFHRVPEEIPVIEEPVADPTPTEKVEKEINTDDIPY